MKQLLLYAVLLCTFVLAACGGSPAPANPTAAPSSGSDSLPATLVPAATQVAPTTAANTSVEPPSGDPFDVIKNATLAQLSAKSFRAKTIITHADGTISNLLIEYVAPDRIRVVTDEGEQIAVKGKGVWLKEGDTWEAGPPGMENLFFNALSKESVEQTLGFVTVSSVKFAGPDLLDGKPMFVYTYDSRVDLGNNNFINGKNKAWIGALDRRVYRLEGENESTNEPGKIDKTVITYEYDIPITIEPPL